MHQVGRQTQTRRDEWAPIFEGTVEGKNGRGLLSKYLIVLDMPREIVNVDLSHPQFSGYLTKRSKPICLQSG